MRYQTPGELTTKLPLFTAPPMRSVPPGPMQAVGRPAISFVAPTVVPGGCVRQVTSVAPAQLSFARTADALTWNVTGVPLSDTRIRYVPAARPGSVMHDALGPQGVPPQLSLHPRKVSAPQV